MIQQKLLSPSFSFSLFLLGQGRQRSFLNLICRLLNSQGTLYWRGRLQVSYYSWCFRIWPQRLKNHTHQWTETQTLTGFISPCCWTLLKAHKTFCHTLWLNTHLPVGWKQQQCLLISEKRSSFVHKEVFTPEPFKSPWKISMYYSLTEGNFPWFAKSSLNSSIPVRVLVTFWFSSKSLLVFLSQ